MIISNQKQEVEVIGEDTSKKAKISQDKLAKLQYILTKGLYKDPVTAVIAEWTNNGVDGVVQAGKNPVDNPVIVSIGRNTKGQFYFSVEDKGTGLADRDFEDICMNYLESTKENSDDLIGSYGIGMKSFLALDRSATFTCVKNGKERVYLVYEGSEFVNYDLISEKDTTSSNGVKAELVIKDWQEKADFVSKAKAKLAYYDTVALLADDVVIYNKIYRNDLFQWATLADTSTSMMHLCLKDVYYPIDWDALGIRAIHIPNVALRFSLKDGITPTPSRESYITNDAAKKMILNRISEVAEWFFDKYNKTVSTSETFVNAYPFIDKTDYDVQIDKKIFSIDELVPFYKGTIQAIKVKGLSLKSPTEYKARSKSLFYEWDTVASINYNNKYRTKLRDYDSIQSNYFSRYNPITTVLVSQTPIGNVREFLKQKYGADTIFVTRSTRKRMLKKGKTAIDSDSYYHILTLKSVPRKYWRDHIKEWQFVRDQVAETFLDETKVETTKEFITWLTAKRDQQAADRKAGLKPSNYKGINKQSGEVTLAYPRKEKYGNDGVFEKKAYKIDTLISNQFLTVLFDEDHKEKANWLYKITLGDKIRYALIGKLESKKIPQYFQFIKYKDFMLDSKPFRRLASAILFNKAIKDYDAIRSGKDAIFVECLGSMDEDYHTLNVYVSNNLKTINVNDKIRDYIIAIAEEKDLYDKELWDVYIRFKKNVEKYDFVTCLKSPNSWDNEERRKYNRLINQMLLFRKKYYNDLPEGAKIVIEKPEVTAKKKDDSAEEEEDDEEEVPLVFNGNEEEDELSGIV